jgi:hypothetical protein
MTFKSRFQDWFPSELKLDKSTLDKNTVTGAVQTHGAATQVGSDGQRSKFAELLTARGFERDAIRKVGFAIETHSGVWSDYRNARGQWAMNPKAVRHVLRVGFPGMFKNRRDIKRLISGVVSYQTTGVESIHLTRQQAKAYRWLIVIHAYFRDGWACRDIAEEYGSMLTEGQAQGIAKRIFNILKGHNEKGLPRKKRGRPARNLNSRPLFAEGMERQRGQHAN